MEKVENIIDQITLLEVKARRRTFAFTFLPVLISLLLIYYTTRQVSEAQEELKAIDKEAATLRKITDSLRLEYFEAKGYQLSPESIKANKLIKLLLNSTFIDSNLIIKYYPKSLDEGKLWVSLKELGYKNIIESRTTNPILRNGRTNTISFGTSVPLNDIKLIALVLIRSGFQVQHVYYSQRNRNSENLVQLIRTAPANGSPDNSRALTISKIQSAGTIDDLLQP